MGVSDDGDVRSHDGPGAKDDGRGIEELSTVTQLVSRFKANRKRSELGPDPASGAHLHVTAVGEEDWRLHHDRSVDCSLSEEISQGLFSPFSGVFQCAVSAVAYGVVLLAKSSSNHFRSLKLRGHHGSITERDSEEVTKVSRDSRGGMIRTRDLEPSSHIRHTKARFDITGRGR